MATERSRRVQAERPALAAFDVSGRVAVITGGAGMLGVRHARAIASAGGIPVLADRNGAAVRDRATEVRAAVGGACVGIRADITKPSDVGRLRDQVLDRFERIDILINNAARDPKVTGGLPRWEWSRFEHYSLQAWQADLDVGLTGAFLCAQAFGSEMAKRRRGVILNISSDLGLIGPDQRIYRKPGLPDDRQPVKPVSYPVVKSALIGLTRYLATYWADRGIRVNALCPGGVRAAQPVAFVRKLAQLIPLGRMANLNEYEGTVLFLVSDASSYMTGSVVTADGGRSCW